MGIKSQTLLIAQVKGEIDYLERELAKWAEGFAKDPAYALEWSGRTFESAAKLKVYRMLDLALTNSSFADDADCMKQTREWVMRQVMYTASTVQQSTSAASNLVKEHERAQYASLVYGFSAILGE